MNTTTRRGFSLVGMLITLLCLLILATILMTSINKRVTGEGSAKEGTVRSFQDQLLLTTLHQSMYVHAMDGGGAYLAPSELTGSGDPAEDTTANLFSAMIAANYTRPSQLISGNEFNANIVADDDYNFMAYSPISGVYWDPGFVADLHEESNVSFAHMPLYGERFERSWASDAPPNIAILGNRGPENGEHDPSSYTYGSDGTWGGHIVFGDGHIEFVKSFTPSGAWFESGGQRSQDNLYAVDDGIGGSDSILSFTKKMTRDGPELQYD